jgi:hypothetical protein
MMARWRCSHSAMALAQILWIDPEGTYKEIVWDIDMRAPTRNQNLAVANLDGRRVARRAQTRARS